MSLFTTFCRNTNLFLSFLSCLGKLNSINFSKENEHCLRNKWQSETQVSLWVSDRAYLLPLAMLIWGECCLRNSIFIKYSHCDIQNTTLLRYQDSPVQQTHPSRRNHAPQIQDPNLENLLVFNANPQNVFLKNQVYE